jgi:hypothetical protein
MCIYTQSLARIRNAWLCHIRCSLFALQFSVFKMKRFWGLRGSRLNIATILMVVCPAYLCYGYNQAVTGGVLTLESFVKVFPQLDTINTTGAQNKYNENIQGLSLLGCWIICSLAHMLRYRHGNVHHWWCVWCVVYNILG